jgi:hypothetical protein
MDQAKKVQNEQPIYVPFRVQKTKGTKFREKGTQYVAPFRYKIVPFKVIFDQILTIGGEMKVILCIM